MPAARPTAAAPAPVAAVGELALAVVKGTRLAHPRAVAIDADGLRDDRRFHVVSAHAMQHGAARAALTRVAADWDPASGRLTLRFPDGAVADGVVAPGEPVVGHPAWDRRRAVRGRAVRGPWSAALSRWLGQEVRLVEASGPRRAHDVAPVTLVGRASAAALGAALGVGDLGVRRFRMNLALDGLASYAEDRWLGRTIAVGGCRLRVTGAVPRCVVVTRDPETARRDHDVLRALAATRPPLPGPDGAPARAPLGVYAEVVQPGVVAVGDRVALLD